jgi:predicted amidohydrolase
VGRDVEEPALLGSLALMGAEFVVVPGGLSAARGRSGKEIKRVIEEAGRQAGKAGCAVLASSSVMLDRAGKEAPGSGGTFAAGAAGEVLAAVSADQEELLQVELAR